MEVAQRNDAATTRSGELSAEDLRDLELRIQKQFASREGQFTLDIAFSAKPGITIVFGASGAGKTTLLNCIAGITGPDSGQITVARQTFFDNQRKINVPVQRRGVGYVLQDLALFPHMTAEENIRYGLVSWSVEERKRRSDAMLESFRISHLRTRRPREISGGERQRVALARTLVTNPCILLLDEPLAALDAATKSKIIEDLRVWNETHSIPILYVTHSRAEVFALGGRVLLLDKGQVIADGVPHEVMTVPRQETIAQLVGFENIFDVTVVSLREDRGTMTCRLTNNGLELETPLVKAEINAKLRVGIAAGDILLASSRPNALSAQNIIPGKIISLAQRDMIIVAKVDCGVEMETHLTLAARDALYLQPGQPVWLVIKTHSCHLMSV